MFFNCLKEIIKDLKTQNCLNMSEKISFLDFHIQIIINNNLRFFNWVKHFIWA